MLWLFWIALGLLLYTFLGYPVLLWVLGRLVTRSHRRASIRPAVSVIIAVHNGATVIREKLENTLNQDYSGEWEIIVVSDGSSDPTCEIVRSFAGRGVILIEMAQRRGKHHAQLAGRNAARGEILVFTDVTALLEPSGLRAMVENFADSSVGVVSSEDVVASKAGGGAGESMYVGGEMKLRRLESQIGSVVSASGSFFGARKKVCEPWDPDSCSDFFVPLQAVMYGLRVVVDPESRARFGVLDSGGAEFGRKVRTIAQGLDVFFSYLMLLNVFRYGLFSVQLVSHKLLRWTVPYLLGVLFVSSVLLPKSSLFYQVFLYLQLFAYGTGILGLALGGRGRWRPLRLAAFFLIGNAATITAWVKFLLGERYVVWEPSRRSYGRGAA